MMLLICRGFLPSVALLLLHGPALIFSHIMELTPQHYASIFHLMAVKRHLLKPVRGLSKTLC